MSYFYRCYLLKTEDRKTFVEVITGSLTLMHLEWPQLHNVLAVLSAIGLIVLTGKIHRLYGFYMTKIFIDILYRTQSVHAVYMTGD